MRPPSRLVLKLSVVLLGRSTARPDPIARGPERPSAAMWRGGAPIAEERGGYLQQLDEAGLADWAANRGVAVRLLARPGEFVFPGVPLAIVTPPADGAEAAVREATLLGPHRVVAADLESSVRQLVEVAVRALASGTKDPATAVSVLDRLGAALCGLAPRHLPTGVVPRDGRPVLVREAIAYDGLTDAMFHAIRQSAAGSAPVLIRLLEVLTAVARRERRPERLAALRRHARLVLTDGRRTVPNPGDRADLARRHARFLAVVRHGSLAGTGAAPSR